jgi:hypothetical protein
MATDDVTADALAQARRAGLDRAVSHYPEDVLAAAEAAAQAQRACAGAGSPTDEPWPPMRVRNPS